MATARYQKTEICVLKFRDFLKTLFTHAQKALVQVGVSAELLIWELWLGGVG